MRGDGGERTARKVELESRDSSWGEGGFSPRSVSVPEMEMLRP